VREAFCFGSGFACIGPAAGIIFMGGPDGVLFFVIYNHLVNDFIFDIVHG
jgi:hypothetical protein